MSFYFTDQIQQSFNKIFHQCNKDIAWEGKAELDALVKLDEEGQKVPGIGDVYAILARVYSGLRRQDSQGRQARPYPPKRYLYYIDGIFY